MSIHTKHMKKRRFGKLSKQKLHLPSKATLTSNLLLLLLFTCFSQTFFNTSPPSGKYSGLSFILQHVVGLRNSISTSHLGTACPDGLRPNFKALARQASQSTTYGSSVLATQIGDEELAGALEEFILKMENHTDGRTISNRGGWQSNDLIGHSNPSLMAFQKLLSQPLESFIEMYGSQQSRKMVIVVDQLWANVNRPGNWNARHNHGSALRSLVASGVYYPTTSPTPLKLYLHNSETVLAVPKAGTLWLFPADMDHEVEPAPQGASPRLSIAMNILLRWIEAPIHIAASEGNEDELRRLVEGGSDIDEKEPEFGFSAIHLAAEAGHIGAIATLVDLGCDATALSYQGWSAFGLAADRGHQETAAFLSKRGLFGPETTGNMGISGEQRALAVAAERGHQSIVELLGPGDSQPLHLATAVGHTAIVELLISQGADPDTGAVGQRRPIHVAASKGHTTLTSLLLSNGADPNAQDGSGNTALHEAVTNGHVGTLQLLLSNPASLNVDVGDQEEVCPLHSAASLGHSEMVEMLISAGASLEVLAKGRAPGRPLHWASSKGHAQLIEQLLSNRANVNADAGFAAQSESAIAKDYEAMGRSTDTQELADAASMFTRAGDVFQRVQLAEVLVRRKVKATAADERGMSALHSAAAFGQVEAARALVAGGADVFRSDSNGAVALHWAAANGHAEIVTYLISSKADVFSKDSKGSTALHDATWSGHSAVAAALIRDEHEHIVRDIDDSLRTPLHIAALLWQGSIAELLVRHGADRQLQDAQGQTPLDIFESTLPLLAVLSKAKSGYGQELEKRVQQTKNALQQK